MGKTAIVKIMERAAGKPVKVGDRVWCKIDWSTARDFGGANCVLQFEKEMGADAKVWDPDKIAFTFDLQAPSHSEKVSTNQKIIREFAKKQGIKKVFDINYGIGQHVMLEAGMIKPGDVVLGTDSHMNLLGGVGAFATGVGNSDIAASWINGTNWFRVPETMKIEVTGKFQKGVCMRDLLTHIVGDLGAGGMDFLAVEFVGETIENSTLADRITLCSMVTEMSGKVPIIMPNGEVLKWLVDRAGPEVEQRVKELSADADAEYCKVLKYDVTNLEPLASCPDAPDNVKPVREVAGTAVDQVHIGSCSNGRFEDIKAAYDVLMAGGGKVSPKVRTIITPSTTEVQLACVKAGMIEKFLEAGIVFTNPTCALCTAEHYGALPSGDVGCSTTNRNFIGKVGKGSHTYLMSPMSAMATAVKGVITDPRDILGQRRKIDMSEILKGRAWVFGDDVDTDLIYHNKYLAETDPKNMPQYAFEYFPGKEHFAKEVKPGDFVVAGKNFGCGSSREHAVYCIEYAGVPVVLAETCSRIYYRNAINNGYPVLFIKGISEAIKEGKIKDGDQLEVELSTGTIKDVTSGYEFHGDAVSDLENDIMQAGGLMEYLKAQAAAKK